MNQFPKMLDDTIARMRKGMAEGLMPPKFLLEKVAVQAEAMAKTTNAARPARTTTPCS